MPFMATGSLDEISEPTVGHAVVAADMDHLIYDSSIDDCVLLLLDDMHRLSSQCIVIDSELGRSYIVSAACGGYVSATVDRQHVAR